MPDADPISERDAEAEELQTEIPVTKKVRKTIQNDNFPRVQSPSSINTYRQCPRKYYYQYIRKLETLPSIHLMRGGIVHEVLEMFFTLDLSGISSKSYDIELNVILHEMFNAFWVKNKKELEKLRLTEQELKFYHKETQQMLDIWFERFSGKLKRQLDHGLSLQDSLKVIRPKTEVHYYSAEHGVQGFIDAVHVDADGKVCLMDYKTSSKNDLSDEYKLQLAIYAMLYNETHGKEPDFVGIDFLRYDEKLVAVDRKLMDWAKKEVALIHRLTDSEDVRDYSKNISPLCKWRNGQCDFYNTCVKE